MVAIRPQDESDHRGRRLTFAGQDATTERPMLFRHLRIIIFFNHANRYGYLRHG